MRRPEPWWRLNAARDDVTTTETFVSTAPDANFVSSSSESAADSPAETSPMTAAASSAGVPAGVPVVPDATAGAVPGLSETQEMRETLEAALARPSEPTPEEGEESGGVKFMGMELKGSIKGMLLLNLGAALFGCNQVRKIILNAMHSRSRRETAVLEELQQRLLPSPRILSSGSLFSPFIFPSFRFLFLTHQAPARRW